MRKCTIVHICANTDDLLLQYRCTLILTLKSISQLLISIYFHTRSELWFS